MHPKQQTSVGLTLVGPPEAKEGSTLFMFDLAASAKHHWSVSRIWEQWLEHLPFFFFVIDIVCCDSSHNGKHIKKYTKALKY